MNINTVKLYYFINCCLIFVRNVIAKPERARRAEHFALCYNLIC